ncbi:hypothetical protein HJG60_011683 [Phyllostomus discolor]|uniref:Uncharacterized protein n=1 Tax=Phyllostomus discolor TaxID=89673 RepID=A0A834E3D5_9CHIR|nr:hypothetical protein HJG60_011683 [Phyllostomus discolor]
MSGLSGDLFGFSALDLIASDKRYKKKVLETWKGPWGRGKCLLSHSLLGLSLGERLSYFSSPRVDQEQLTVPAKTQPLSQEKGVTLPTGMSQSDPFGAEGNLSSALEVDCTLERDAPGCPQKMPCSWSPFSVSMPPRHLEPK